MSEWTFNEVRNVLHISQEQFNMLDKLDGNPNNKISDSVFRAACEMRVKKQGEESGAFDTPWNKKDKVSAETKQVMHAILDGNYTDWERPKNIQVKNLKFKDSSNKGADLPDDVKQSLHQYLKDLLRVYQTTGKLDKNGVTSMIPANMKISIILKEQDIFTYKDEKNDKNDYTQKENGNTHHHKVADGIKLGIRYTWTDPSGKSFTGFTFMSGDLT